VNGHDPDELSAYALGLLDAGEAARVEAHVAACEGCRADLAELRATAAALDRLPVETFVHGPPESDRALRRALERMRRDDDPGR
jgi:anti-sigma factor RsiW